MHNALVYFLQLKGCDDLKKEIDDILELLHLEDKRYKQARTLSGGMKRKLCVGIALIGGSSVSGDVMPRRCARCLAV